MNDFEQYLCVRNKRLNEEVLQDALRLPHLHKTKHGGVTLTSVCVYKLQTSGCSFNVTLIQFNSCAQ